MMPSSPRPRARSQGRARPRAHVRVRRTLQYPGHRLLRGLAAVVLGVPLALLALGAGLLVGGVALLGSLLGLGVACLAVGLPLAGLLLWGWRDGVWLQVTLRDGTWDLGLRFPVPVTALRWGSVLVDWNGRRLVLPPIPWKEVRAVLREEPITVDIVDPSDQSEVHIVLGPRG